MLERLMSPQGRDLPPEVARYFLDLSFTEEEQKRISELSEKANEGELSEAEREELRVCVMINDLLVMMQSRARASMKSESPAA